MRVGVAGATGFLGSRLVDALAGTGHEVIRLVRSSSLGQIPGSGLNIVNVGLDESDNAITERIGYFNLDSVVLAGAAYNHHDDPGAVRELVDGNILFPSRIVAAAYRAKVRSAIVIGSPWQEAGGHGYLPRDLYSATKEAFSRICGFAFVVPTASSSS